MNISPARTVAVPVAASGYGAPATAPLVWPAARPGDALDYSLDLTALLAEVGDTPLSVSAAAAPSGSGELALTALAMAGSVATVWLTGGVPGRFYRVRTSVVTAGGRTFELDPVLEILPGGATLPPPPPQSAGFGAALTAQATGTTPGLATGPGAIGTRPDLDFGYPGNSAMLAMV